MFTTEARKRKLPACFGGAGPTQFAPSSLRAVCDAGPLPGSRMRVKRKKSIPVENRFIVHPSERGYKTLSVKVADSIATDAPKNRTGPARSRGRDMSQVGEAVRDSGRQLV